MVCGKEIIWFVVKKSMNNISRFPLTNILADTNIVNSSTFK